MIYHNRNTVRFRYAGCTLTTHGLPVHLHLFSTGSIAGRLSRRWQPIWVLAIDHPDGIFLVDTGERTRRPHWYLDILYKFDLSRDDEVDRQLARVNISTQQVKTILLTHRHFDHIDGLAHFPHTPIFHDTLNDTCESFTKAHYLTPTKDLAVVYTPGHTRDHCSVLLRTDTFHILFAGDMAETQQQLLEKKIQPAVKTYAHYHPLILLLTHDPLSNVRLATREPLPSPKTGTPPPTHP